jgi:type II secretory ATPase GspE/PulE/Tfp pilus assembly ATPase PilB-like protein
VFSTLHTNDSATAFIRLIDIGIKPFLVAAGIKAVLAQRLMRTICTTCKEPYTPTQEEIDLLGVAGVEDTHFELFKGTGCDNCNHTGYSGRIGAYELLLTTDEIRRMIMEGKSATALRRASRLAGMVTMREDAWKKALRGITTIEEVNKRTKIDEPLVRKSEFVAAG